MRGRSWFGKAEYLVFPWLLGSLKAERFTLEPAPSAIPAGYTVNRVAVTRVLPGVVALVRQNGPPGPSTGSGFASLSRFSLPNSHPRAR